MSRSGSPSAVVGATVVSGAAVVGVAVVGTAVVGAGVVGAVVGAAVDAGAVGGSVVDGAGAALVSVTVGPGPSVGVGAELAGPSSAGSEVPPRSSGGDPSPSVVTGNAVAGATVGFATAVPGALLVAGTDGAEDTPASVPDGPSAWVPVPAHPAITSKITNATAVPRRRDALWQVETGWVRTAPVWALRRGPGITSPTRLTGAPRSRRVVARTGVVCGVVAGDVGGGLGCGVQRIHTGEVLVADSCDVRQLRDVGNIGKLA